MHTHPCLAGTCSRFRRSSPFHSFPRAALFTLLPLSSSLAQAAVFTAASAARDDVAAAVALAAEGDIVRIPAGNVIWTRVLHVTKGISIIGAGVGQTIIADNINRASAPEGVNIGESIFSVATTAGKSYRISGLTLTNAAPAPTTTHFNGMIQITGTSSEIRIDNLRFEFPTGTRHGRCVYWFNYTRGVMHDVTFNLTSAQAFTVFHDTWAGSTEGNGSWAASDQAGTAEMVYVEDCVLIRTDNGGLSDGFSGARFCVRYSTIRNGHLATHGTESTGRHRGTRWVEAYHNTFEHPIAGSNAYGIDYRSGTGVFFNNTGTGGHQAPVHMSNYRNIDHFVPWGMADGRNAFDRNDTNGGTGNPFESGSHTGANGAASISDSSKTWTTNQWANYHVHRIGPSGVASAGSGLGTLVVTGAGWTPNQWVNWTVKNEATGRVRLITSNSADTIVFAGEGLWSFSAGQTYSVYFPKHIASNTATTLTLSNSAFGAAAMTINNGDTYRIYRILEPLDMPGMGQSTAFTGSTIPSPVAWPNQAVSPIYVWNNSFEGQSGGVVSARPPITANVHYIVGTPKPGYTPFPYPHPLRRPAAPSNLRLSAP